MVSKKQISLIERTLSELITDNSIDDKSIDDTLCLLIGLIVGIEDMRLFNETFYNNLVSGGALIDDKFVMSKEDMEYNGIWFLMTILVGQGLLRRTCEE